MGMSVEVKLPESCECGFENLKLHGTRVDGNVYIEVKCMKCGKILWKKEN